MYDRRTFLKGLAASTLLGSFPAHAGLGEGVQRSLFMEMAKAYALNDDRRAFRSLFRVQNLIRQIGAFPGTEETVERAMGGLARVIDGEHVPRVGFQHVKRLPGGKVVVFSDHHILPDDNRQSGVWRTNRDGYAKVLRHYGEDAWTVVENGDVEDLVVLEPHITEGMYAEVLREDGKHRPIRARHGRALVESFRERPMELIERLVAARSERRQGQIDAILNAPGNTAYYGVLEELAGSGQLVRVAGNHDYDLQTLAVPDHLVPVDVAIVERDLPYAILHGHQFDQATAPGVATLYGEVISECLGIWFQGPDRIWEAKEVRRILEGGFPNRMSTHGEHSADGPMGTMVAALFAGREKADADWAATWEGLFGHPIAWEYGARDWRQSVRHGAVRPGDLIDQAMLGKQFFKFRHLDEAQIVYAMERWKLDIGLVLGHSHEVRDIQAGRVGRYYNSGAAGRFANLLWALEITDDDVQVVAWHIEPDGACSRYIFEHQESELFSFFDVHQSEGRIA